MRCILVTVSDGVEGYVSNYSVVSLTLCWVPSHAPSCLLQIIPLKSNLPKMHLFLDRRFAALTRKYQTSEDIWQTCVSDSLQIKKLTVLGGNSNRFYLFCSW